MALPQQLKSARLNDSSPGSSIDNEMGNVEKAIADILGAPQDTDINAALFEVLASGLRKIFLVDLAGNPTVAGQLSRNGATLRFHDGTAARELVNSTRQVIAGAGLSGGGPLTGDVTLSVSQAIGIQVFTTTGTWNKPANLSAARIIVIGGGGGGGGVDLVTNNNAAAGGGGAGQYSESFIAAADLGATEAVTIGAGGVGGVTAGPDGQNGLPGGDTSFGSHVVAKGGSPGLGTVTANDVGVGGDGGAASGGTGQVKIDGSDGDHGAIDAQWSKGGRGAGSIMGASKKGPLLTSSGATAGNAGKNHGGGGTGAAVMTNNTSVAGGDGAKGVIIVLEFK